MSNTNKFDINNFDINSVLEELCERRKLFHGESDLQFEMVEIIKEYTDCIVRVEHPFIDDKDRKYMDILITDKEYKKGIAIELKYKTTNKDYKNIEKEKGKVIINNEPYILGHQEARNNNCYYTLKDVERLQKLIGTKLEDYEIEIIKGYVIFITNDIHYMKYEMQGNAKDISLNIIKENYTREFSSMPSHKTDKNKFPDLELNKIKGKWNKEHIYNENEKLYTLIFEI